MYLHKWEAVTVERLKGGLTRQMIHTDSFTIARLGLDAGAVVPRHSHINEQVSTVESGMLRFILDSGEELIVGPGESLQIPSNVPHEVHAMEQTVALDIFCPVREDWRRGDDAYLREG
jgi:quercetin dioxygenase-like cupin family protein